MDLHIIAGLGNPGTEYAGTRHNIGFMMADFLCSAYSGEWKSESKFNALVAKIKMGRHACLLIKPQTFMNLSGQSIGGLARYYDIPADKIVVAHDEFQIAVGEMKLSIGGGDGGHNGIANIISHIGNTFTRFRLGIGSSRPLENGLKGFVLNKFETSEIEVISKKMTDFSSGIRLVVDSGPIIAMNHLNKRIKHNDSSATA